tara:strand:+ start:244 stop:387 length:144 start_codon:yes stop_codon:yes gene_type:complete
MKYEIKKGINSTYIEIGPLDKNEHPMKILAKKAVFNLNTPEFKDLNK